MLKLLTNVIVIAFVSFISTNIDDIFILMLFFSQINSDMKKRHIVIGQYLGIGVLVVISIIGSLGVSVVPQEYVGLLGLVPIYLGIKTYIDNRKENKNTAKTGQNEFRNDCIVEAQGETESKRNSLLRFKKNFINPSVAKVFSVTLANGGDNIGIYIPLFTNMSLMEIWVTVIIFILLTALWCYIGLRLSEYPFIRRNIEKYKHIFVPIIFIGLGIFILLENGTINFICEKLI